MRSQPPYVRGRPQRASGRRLTLRRRRPQWRARRADWWLRAAVASSATLGAALLVAVVDFIADDPLHFEKGCVDRPFGCGMATGLAVTVFAVAITFVFWSILRKDRLVATYRASLQPPPTDL